MREILHRVQNFKEIALYFRIRCNTTESAGNPSRIKALRCYT